MTISVKPGTYRLEVYDNEIDADLQTEVLNYLLDSEYCVNFYDPSHSFWDPRADKYTTPRNYPATPRLPLAWDDRSLEHRAPVIYKLWQAINAAAGDTMTIEGCPEGMNYMTGISPLTSLTKADGTPGKPNSAWRVYGNCIEREPGARTKAIHRDNPYMDDDSCITIVYFGNKEWYPSWWGETMFHSDVSTTGDFTGRFQKDQPRNFPIGEIENVVEVRPGRFMLYDSRYMHQIKPVYQHVDQLLMGIVFRAKLK